MKDKAILKKKYYVIQMIQMILFLMQNIIQE